MRCLHPCLWHRPRSERGGRAVACMRELLHDFVGLQGGPKEVHGGAAHPFTTLVNRQIPRGHSFFFFFLCLGGGGSSSSSPTPCRHVCGDSRELLCLMPLKHTLPSSYSQQSNTLLLQPHQPVPFIPFLPVPPLPSPP